MPSKVTLFHKVDGAVEIDSCHVDEALIHKDEWASEPWVEAEEAPAKRGPGRPPKAVDAPADEPSN